MLHCVIELFTHDDRFIGRTNVLRSLLAPKANTHRPTYNVRTFEMFTMFIEANLSRLFTLVFYVQMFSRANIATVLELFDIIKGRARNFLAPKTLELDKHIRHVFRENANLSILAPK